jgi:alpha-glucosidase
MNKAELEQYFLAQLVDGKATLTIAKGRASYQMKRGSFKTRDHIVDRRKLPFVFQEGNRYLFSDGRVSAEIIVDRSPFIKFHFHVDTGYNRFKLTFQSFPNEHIYGCGEQYTHLDLKGQKVTIWVSEHQRISCLIKKFLREKLHGVNPDYQAPYKNHQTYYSAPCFVSSENYAFYCHEDTYGQLVFSDNEIAIKFRQIPQSISLLTADSPLELVSELTTLIGRQPPLPDWVNDGAILAIQGGSDVLLKKVEAAKKAGVKIAAVWCQDWSGHVVTKFGYQVFWNWKVDEKLYPNLKGIIQKLNGEGIRFLGYINTFLKEGAPYYLEAKKKGFLVRKKCGHPYLIKSTTFNAGILDLTNPSAYEWYKALIKDNMIGLNLSGWMADFGEYLPTDAVVYGGIPEKLHNRWPSMWAKCCHEAVVESGKENEIFFFSRAAYGHTVQYTNSMWNGDQHVDYSDEYGLGSVIPTSLSMSYSGVGVVHSDIGGYTTILHMKWSADLFNRWSELELFFPVYRTHEGNRPKENVQFDDPRCLKEFARNSQIFAALKPYRLYLLEEYETKGYPFIRPLSFDEKEVDPAINQREFLMGDEVLVSPVLRGNESEHQVYLPAGEWVQLFTGKAFDGGTFKIPSPPGLPVAFYKKGCRFAALFESLKDFNKGE